MVQNLIQVIATGFSLFAVANSMKEFPNAV
jgi:hypothetical protein